MAAGNTGSNLDIEPAYPPAYDAEFSNMIVVASTDYHDRISNFSNYGEQLVDIGAPGEWLVKKKLLIITPSFIHSLIHLSVF